MHSDWRAKCLVTLAFCLSLLALSLPVQAAIIHESATLGPTGVGFGSGFTIGSGQYLGSRFSVSGTVEVDQIGGHIAGGFGSTIFGAIINLQSPTALPVGTPFAAGTVVASTTFTPSSPSADNLVPLSVTLVPGDYGLIFGSGMFGSPSFGIATMPGGDTNITGSASYFLWNGFNWANNSSFNNTRFVVSSPVPIPGAMLLFGSGLAALGAWRHRKGKKS